MLQKMTLTLVIMFFCTGSLYGNDTDSSGIKKEAYTLSDLYENALEFSKEVKISQEDLFISEKTKDKAKSVLIPRLTGFGEHTMYNKKKIYFGSIIQPNSQTAWGLRLDQSVTLNGKELIAYRIAGKNIEKNKHDLNAVKEGLLFDVATAYYDVLMAKKIKEIAEANVTRLESHLDAVSTRLALEEVPKTSLFRAEAELSKAKTDLISARNGIRLSKAVLSMVSEVPGTFEIVEPQGVDSLLTPDELILLKMEALNERSEIKSLEIINDVAKETVKYEKSAYWPTLSVEAMYINTEMDPESPYSNDDSMSLGLKINVPLYDGGLKQANIKESLSKKRQARLQKEAVEKAILLDMEKAYLELLTQQSVLTSLEDQLSYADENYKAVERQFKHGLANSIDAMDANTLLATSEQELSEAQYSFQLAVLRLKRVKGTLLKDVLEQNITESNGEQKNDE